MDRADHDHLGTGLRCHRVRHRSDQLSDHPAAAGIRRGRSVPGIVLLFTYWFPDHHRARIVSSFTLALPISVALGAPVSTAILGLDGWLGYAGWKWIFLLEAVPTIVIGIVVLFALTDKPAKAAWLDAEEKNWRSARWTTSAAWSNQRANYSMWQALVNPKIVLLSINYLGIVTASLGLLLFVPQIIKSLGTSNMGTGYATMLAYVCGAISMMAWGWISDRMGERRWNLFWACTLATAGLVIAGMTMGTWWALVGMCIATAGFYGTKGPFWSMPSMIAHRRRGGGRHRLDQLDWQCGGAEDRPWWAGSGCHRQLFRRSFRPGVFTGVSALIAHSRCTSRARCRTRPRRRGG